MKPIIYYGLPMGSRTGNDFQAVTTWANCGSRRPERYDILRKESHAGHNFLNLWCEMLNLRNSGVTHYAGQHTDVVPLDPWWIDVGMDLLEKFQARIVSFVVTLKDDTGQTSTGYARRWPPGQPTVKLTKKEVAALPETFSIRDVKPDDSNGDYCLSLNNGLFLADVRPTVADGTREDWASRITWACDSGFVERIDHQGRYWYDQYFRSEDWLESKTMADHLQPEEILASRAVPNLHFGYLGIPSWESRADKCPTCHDRKLIDSGADTVPCPACVTEPSLP